MSTAQLLFQLCYDLYGLPVWSSIYSVYTASCLQLNSFACSGMGFIIFIYSSMSVIFVQFLVYFNYMILYLYLIYLFFRLFIGWEVIYILLYFIHSYKYLLFSLYLSSILLLYFFFFASSYHV